MDEVTRRYYQALNLEPSASAEEIYQAYRDLVRVWDPQRFANSPRLEMMAEEKLNEIIAAYHALERLRASGGAGVSEGSAGGGLTAGPAAPPVADRYRAPDPPFSAVPAAPAAPPPVTRPEAATSVIDAPVAVADRYRPAEAPFSNMAVQTPAVPAAPPAQPVAEQQRPPEAAFPAAPSEQAPVIRPEPAPGGLNGTTPVAEARPAFRFTAAPSAPEDSGLTATVTVAPTTGGPTKYLDEPVAQATPAPPVQQAGPSRNVRFAVAGACSLLVVAAIFFLFEVLSGPVPSRAKSPDSAAAQTLAADMMPAESPAHRAEAVPSAGATEAGGPERAQRRRKPAAVAPEEAPRQVPTGTELMTPEGRTGVGKFRIVNQSGEDAVARLVSHDSPTAALRLVYIRTGTEVAIGGIGTGVYYVTFSMGPLTSKPRVFGKQFGPFQFMQIQSTGGYESDQYQILLKPRK